MAPNCAANQLAAVRWADGRVGRAAASAAAGYHAGLGPTLPAGGQEEAERTDMASLACKLLARLAPPTTGCYTGTSFCLGKALPSLPAQLPARRPAHRRADLLGAHTAARAAILGTYTRTVEPALGLKLKRLQAIQLAAPRQQAELRGDEVQKVPLRGGHRVVPAQAQGRRQGRGAVQGVLAPPARGRAPAE